MFEKSSPLKQIGQMEPNLAVSIKKNDEKRAITPRRVIRFTSKFQGS
jgi:uncharacterized protein YcsI (UPF0317 family)